MSSNPENSLKSEPQMQCKYSLVIPAYNEEENLKPLVDEILEKLKGNDYEIIIVDDNSKDKTPQISDELSKNPKISCIHRTEGRNGMGYALLEGSQKARGKYIVWVMADKSDKIEVISDMIAKLEGGYDMVVGSRYMKGGSKGELQPDKALYSSTYSQLAKIVFGLQVDDITNAFRAFRKKILDDVKIESGDFAISPEFAIKTHLKGYKVTQVPATYFKRQAGQAKFKIMQMGIRYLSLLRLKIQYKR